MQTTHGPSGPHQQRRARSLPQTLATGKMRGVLDGTGLERAASFELVHSALVLDVRQAAGSALLAACLCVMRGVPHDICYGLYRRRNTLVQILALAYQTARPL